MNNNNITRKKFFTLAGIAGLGAVVLNKTPLKHVLNKKSGTAPLVTVNPLAVKRENRGKQNG